MKNLTSLFILFFLFCGCKEDKEILKGTAIGIVYTIDQYHSLKLQLDDPYNLTLLTELTGATVNLYQDSTLLSTVITDEHGRYSFTDLPYGKYNIDVQKDGYANFYSHFPFNHIGGDSPTNVDLLMEEIPTFQFSIDSARYLDGINFILHLKLNGQDYYPVNSAGTPVMIYASDEQDVSYANYKSRGIGSGNDVNYSGNFEKIPIYVKIDVTNPIGHMDANFYELSNGPVYIRIYPAPECELDYSNFTIDPKFLGPPSNVIELVTGD